MQRERHWTCVSLLKTNTYSSSLYFTLCSSKASTSCKWFLASADTVSAIKHQPAIEFLNFPHCMSLILLYRGHCFTKKDRFHNQKVIFLSYKQCNFWYIILIKWIVNSFAYFISHGTMSKLFEQATGGVNAIPPWIPLYLEEISRIWALLLD